MKTQLMWVGSLVLAVVVVAGCNSKKSDNHDGMKSMEHSEHESVKKPSAGTQTTCPVMGGKIVKNIYGDHMGKRVYLCCQGCVDTFNKNPMKYIKQLEDAGVVLDKTPS